MTHIKYQTVAKPLPVNMRVEAILRGEDGGIGVADYPGGDALDAAAALQRVMGRMTGLMVPIRTVGEQKAHPERASQASILVGASKWTTEMGIDVAQDQEAGDRYVIRTALGCVAVAGNDAGVLRGTVYGV